MWLERINHFVDKTYPLRVIYYGLVLLLLIIGIQLIIPTDTFDGGKGWRLIASIFTETQAGTILIVISLAALVVLRFAILRLRFVTALLVATIYFVIGITFLLSNPAGIGSFLMCFLSLLCYYVIFLRFRGVW